MGPHDARDRVKPVRRRWVLRWNTDKPRDIQCKQRHVEHWNEHADRHMAGVLGAPGSHLLHRWREPDDGSNPGLRHDDECLDGLAEHADGQIWFVLRHVKHAAVCVGWCNAHFDKRNGSIRNRNLNMEFGQFDASFTITACVSVPRKQNLHRRGDSHYF